PPPAPGHVQPSPPPAQPIHPRLLADDHQAAARRSLIMRSLRFVLAATGQGPRGSRVPLTTGLTAPGWVDVTGRPAHFHPLRVAAKRAAITTYHGLQHMLRLQLMAADLRISEHWSGGTQPLGTWGAGPVTA